ncbi:MAG: hypothetical protein ACI88H_002604 [Cocleimonas sp.]|jgi:hypothetical protein
MNNNRQTIPELNEMLVKSGIESVVSYLVGSENYHRTPTRISMAGYQGGKDGQSFVVELVGSNAGMWYENNLADSPNEKSRGDLLELWSVVNGINKGEACKEIRAYLNITTSTPVPSKSPILSVVKDEAAEAKKRLSHHLGKLKPVSQSSLDKLQARLMKNEAALNYLYNRGLNDQTISHFKLGLTSPYTLKDGTGRIQNNCLAFPLLGNDGVHVTPNSSYNVPGVTTNPKDDNGWAQGSPRLTYNTKRLESHDFLLYAEGMKDLWILHQLLFSSNLYHRVLVVSSTHGSRVPLEVINDPMTLSGFKKIFAAQDADDAGEKNVAELSAYLGTNVYRLRPPFDGLDKDRKDWTDFVREGGTIDDLIKLIKEATQIKKPTIQEATNINDLVQGRSYSFAPIDISCAFVNNYFYYPTISLETALDPATNAMTFGQVIKVVRSDKQVLGYRQLPKLNRPGVTNTPLYALDDGTLINDIPKFTANGWDWKDIEKWLDGDFKSSPLKDILRDLVTVFKSQIWLPNKDDYIILSLVVVVTYVQNIFEAVPLVLATGAAGSGKSQLGIVMSKVSCNAVILGDTSAATIARTLDETRGFLMLDDVEKICSRVSNGNVQMDDFLQILKVSYKKSTAFKAVTDTKSMIVKTLNFYGVKFMTNTQGIEEILGTRTITIKTRKANPGTFSPSSLDIEKTSNIQKNLYAFAMENAEDISLCYKKYPQSNRSQEITAPLRALLDIAGLDEQHVVIDRLVERMAIDQKSSDSPLDVLREAIHRIASRGFDSVSIEQVVMEFRTLVPANFNKERTTDIADWERTDWIKSQLVNMNYIPSHTATRFRPNGTKTSQWRLYPLTQDLINDLNSDLIETRNSYATTMSGKDFCKKTNCSNCHYNSIECDIRTRTFKR